MIRSILACVLYAALGILANTATTTASAADQAADKAALEALREGEMRKLVVHAEPKPFREITFAGPGGTKERLSDSRGKIRVLNFWATWCAPCKAEKPALDALEAALGGPGFEVIALATGRNSEASIKRFNAELGIQALKTRTDRKSKAAGTYGVLALPVSIILDREGREIARLVGGADWNSESARAILEALMAAEG